MPPRRLFEFSPPLPPPPPSSVLQYHTSEDHDRHGSDGVNPSLLFIGGIVAFVFVVSVSLHFLLRYLHRRCSSAGPGGGGEDDDDDDEVIHVAAPAAARASRVAPEEDERRHSLLESLPLFAFSALRRPSSSSSSSSSDAAAAAAGADCAVCLSKFEPHDLLRLLPVCCHAFHAGCIDTWLVSNQTCPLCRSTIFVDESDVEGMLKGFGSSAAPSSASNGAPGTGGRGGGGGDQSFRIEIGSVSRRRAGSESGEDRRRSYSLGSFDYVIDGDDELGSEQSGMALGHRRGASSTESNFGGKKSGEVVVVVPPSAAVAAPGADLAAEVAGVGRGWLRDYVDRIASSSSSSFSSFRLSGRFFAGSGRRTSDGLGGSSRRSDGIAAVSGRGSFDFDRNGLGEEIGNLFRWLSWV